MRENLVARGIALAVVLTLSSGCRTYHITQADYVASGQVLPNSIRRAAIITDADDHDKLIREAFQVGLMQRGLEVVEREQFSKLVNEQMLIRGELTNLSDREKAIRVGKILNVDVVFYADSIVHQTRFVYEPHLFGSSEQARLFQERANKTGVVEGVGSFSIHAYHDVGITVRAIDAKSGEILWVGYRMLAICDEVTKKSPTALTNFAAVQQLCDMVLDDFFGRKRVTDNEKGLS